ncbi:hypothetical protein [Circoviridae sp.]|nr:hypothetical protein [Circoviridae sp.]
MWISTLGTKSEYYVTARLRSCEGASPKHFAPDHILPYKLPIEDGCIITPSSGTGDVV